MTSLEKASKFQDALIFIEVGITCCFMEPFHKVEMPLALFSDHLTF